MTKGFGRWIYALCMVGGLGACSDQATSGNVPPAEQHESALTAGAGGPADCTGTHTIEIHSCSELQAAGDRPTCDYRLASDIECSGFDAGDGHGFRPIGRGGASYAPYTGRFDGAGHVIRGLRIDRGSDSGVGLFGFTARARITRVGVEGAEVRGLSQVGVLLGSAVQTTVDQSFVTGTVHGRSYTGGLAGRLKTSSALTDSYSRVVLDGMSTLGLLLGEQEGASVSRAFAAATSNRPGALVGTTLGVSPLSGGYFDCTLAGPCSGATAQPTAQLQSQSFLSAAGYDFEHVWAFRASATYACLRWEAGCTPPPPVSDPPSVTLTAPADGAQLGPRQSVGETCDTGVGGTYGITVSATLDQGAATRRADILVNGTVVASNVSITGTTVTHCVAVPDNAVNVPQGASTVTVRATSLVTAESASGSAHVDVRTLAIAAPTAGQVLTPADDCISGDGSGASVLASVDVSHNGASLTFANGAHSLATTVALAQASGCLALDAGAQTITATIGAGPITASVGVTAHWVPSTGIVIAAPPAPSASDSGYRAAPVAATWPAPVQDYPGQLVAYELRCASSALSSAASAGFKNDWWLAAEVTALPPGLVPSGAPGADLALRIGDIRHCVLRASDAAGWLTPIVQSTELTKLFRQQVVSAPSSGSYVGSAIAAVGDVDGDGRNDWLAGGYGRAELYFGRSGDLPSAADVVFVGAGGTGVGNAVAGIGDFNGDGLDDFAISNPEWNGFIGRVSVFFGRPAAAWPTGPIDIETSCNADLCLDDELAPPVNVSALGYAVAGAGDFDGDGAPDLAIGSAYYPASSGDGQVFIVLGDSYEQRSCTSGADCRASESCDAGSCALAGGATFWQLQYELPSAEWQNPPSGVPTPALRGFVVNGASGAGAMLGWSFAALGDFDSYAGAAADLAISAPMAGEVQYLSGRAHSGAIGLDVLGPSDLGLRDTVSGTPDGFPIATGLASENFGYAIASLGDFFTPAGATNGAGDLAASGVNTDDSFVFGGEATSASDSGFSTAPVRIVYPGSNVGQYFASSQHPSFGMLGDLDGDGAPELCAGTRTNHAIGVWYGDRVQAAGATLSASDGIEIIDASGSADIAPQLAGDLNGDGHADIVVGDPYASTDDGRVVVLY